MAFGNDPFGNNNKYRNKRLTPLQFFILFLVLWYLFSHHFF